MFDMDEAIEACKERMSDNERLAFAVGTGRVAPMLGKRKLMKKTMEFIQKQEGFIGIYPVDLWHTLLIFDTLNNAKGARNILTAKGIQMGEIAPLLIPKENSNNG